MIEQLTALRPHLTENAAITIFSVWGFLLTATLIGVVLGMLKPGPAMESVNVRIRAWWFMTALITGTLVLGELPFVIFMALVSFLALKEFFSLVPTRLADHRALFWSYGSIPVQYVAVQQQWFGLFVLYIPLYHLLVGPLRVALRRNTKGFVDSSTNIHWGLMLTVFCLSHVAFLAKKDIGLVLFLLILTELNDVSQFIWGKLFGKRKVIAEVSPNKTWEGLLGGVLNTTLLGAFLAPHLTPANWAVGALIGCVVGWTGFCGDIVMSAVKRDMNVKDASEIIPGHGGVLDRVDSLAYTAPLVFYIFHFWY